MLRLLANENVPIASVQLLRDAGHDTVAVAESFPGSTDREVLSRAAQERRIVVTFDRDYGELIFRHRLPAPAGIIYLRFQPATPTEPAERLLQLASLVASLADMFIVIDRDQIRHRPLPPR